jgi:predicted DNA-binding ribbon-helix-helix protein
MLPAEYSRLRPARSAVGVIDARPRKRSLTLRGHRTSVSLEAEFWHAFQAIAAADGKSVNALAAEIDAARGSASGLAGAIRLHVLRRLLAMAEPDRAHMDSDDGRARREGHRST